MTENIEYRGFNIVVDTDDNPQDPRGWDNLGTMLCWYRGYDFGDTETKKELAIDRERYSTREEVEKYIFDELDALVALPLYVYEHSGVTMNTTGFSCPWDSSFVGFIYVSKEKARKEYSYKRKVFSKRFINRLASYLKSEVETYDNYISGEVYGYGVEDADGDDCCCGCWGFFGYDHKASGLLDYAHDDIDCEITARAKEDEKKRQYKQKQVKHWIRKKLPLDLRFKLNLNIV